MPIQYVALKTYQKQCATGMGGERGSGIPVPIARHDDDDDDDRTELAEYQLIDLVGRVFANDPEDLGSIPVRVIPKTLKMVLDTSLLNTQQYKVSIKDKVEQSRERCSALPYTSV